MPTLIRFSALRLTAALLPALLAAAAAPARGQILNTRFLRLDPLPVAVGPDAGRNAMALADLDGDQRLDLVAIAPDLDSIVVYRGLTGGGFELEETVEIDGTPLSVAVADVAAPFDSESPGPDGKPDILVGDDLGVLIVLAGSSDFVFDPAQVVETDLLEVRSLVSGQFDDAPGTDVALMDDAYILPLCNDAGTLAPCGGVEPIEVGDEELLELAALDLDADGHTDLATLGSETQRVVPFFGDGLGGFTIGNGVSVEGEATSGRAVDMTVAHVDADATDDLVVVNSADNFELFGVTLLGRADRRLRTRAFVVDFQASAVAAADFDGVEGLDVIVGYDDGGLTINVGDGDSGFEDPFTPIGSNRVPAVGAIESPDLDRDGRPDLVVLSRDGSQVIVLLNVSGPLCPGDCNVNNQVSIDELLRGVNILLGETDPRDCLALERNGQDGVSVDELVAAVGSALNGCSL
ncbi:MAG: VCBS repeat-containing protein [Deltaproteobacteria bacterium]|nr:VCBS repeat-containing protein [Deltaproteobacteria bacterium]